MSATVKFNLQQLNVNGASKLGHDYFKFWPSSGEGIDQLVWEWLQYRHDAVFKYSSVTIFRIDSGITGLCCLFASTGLPSWSH
jgi:hypothetical protein